MAIGSDDLRSGADAPTPAPSAAVRAGDADTSLTGVYELVKNYALQETVEPLKGAGRYLGFGAAGALLLGLGGSLILLGLLRVLQTEWTRSATGLLSWVSYAIVLVVAALLILLAVSRINKSSLGREGDG